MSTRLWVCLYFAFDFDCLFHGYATLPFFDLFPFHPLSNFLSLSLSTFYPSIYLYIYLSFLCLYPVILDFFFYWICPFQSISFSFFLIYYVALFLSSISDSLYSTLSLLLPPSISSFWPSVYFTSTYLLSQDLSFCLYIYVVHSFSTSERLSFFHFIFP